MLTRAGVVSPNQHSSAYFRRDGFCLVRLARADNGFYTLASFELDGRAYGKKLSGGRVNEVISGPPLFTKLMDMPPMPGGEALETARFLERDSVPFGMDAAIVDVLQYKTYSPGNIRRKSLMAAVPASEAEKRRERLASRGFTMGRLIPAVSSIASLIRHSRTISKSAPAAFIVMEPPSLGIYIFLDETAVFTREITGPAGSARVYRQWAAEQTARSLENFERSSGSPRPVTGYLTGEQAAIEGAGGGLSQTVGTGFGIYDPLNDFVAPHPSFSKLPVGTGPALALAIGAACGDGETLDLSAKRFGYGVKARVAAVLAVVALGAGLIFSMAVKPGSNNAGQNRDYASAVKELESVNTGNLKMEMELAAYPAVTNAGPDWELTFKTISRVMPANAALSRLTITPGQSRGALRNTRLEGAARGSDAEKIGAIELLVNGLKESPAFADVSLTRAKIDATGAGETSFEIAANLVVENMKSPAGASREKIRGDNG